MRLKPGVLRRGAPWNPQASKDRTSQAERPPRGPIPTKPRQEANLRRVLHLKMAPTPSQTLVVLAGNGWQHASRNKGNKSNQTTKQSLKSRETEKQEKERGAREKPKAERKPEMPAREERKLRRCDLGSRWRKSWRSQQIRNKEMPCEILEKEKQR